ncbi:MAG TPA: hypothetical protein VJC03_05720 [bacterium]|nr:hypothetical protein [bacterium]
MVKRFKRKIVIIKRGLQFKFAFFILLGMSLALLTTGFTYHLVIDFMREKLASDPSALAFLERLNAYLYFQIALLIIIAMALSLLASHKLGGPVFHIEHFFEDLNSTMDFSKRVQLREGDELRSLGDKINTFMENMEKKMMGK